MSKTRGPSKAQAVLNEARGRRDTAMLTVAETYAAWQMATAVLEAHREAYEALERTLTRATPRRLPKQEPVKKGTATEPVCVECVECGFTEAYSGHDPTYLKSHPFVPPAVRKSSRKGAGKVSIANTENVTGDVLAVGASGD